MTVALWEYRRPLDEDCSLVGLSDERIIASGRNEAVIVNVADPTSPSLVAKGPSLGTQLQLTSAGLVSLLGAHSPDYEMRQVALHSISGNGWPRLEWTSTLPGASKVVAWSHQDGSYVAAVGQGTGVWTAQLDGPSEPVWSELPALTAPNDWAPRSLVAARDRLYIGRIRWNVDDEGWIQAYQLHDPELTFIGETFLPGYEDLTATLIDSLLVVHGDTELTFMATGGDRGGLAPPTILGSAPFARGIPDRPGQWSDKAAIPRLVPVSPRHFYVTAHPRAEVWRAR
jgi:hypothetical protein